jgi:hypothetical protein
LNLDCLSASEADSDVIAGPALLEQELDRLGQRAKPGRGQ